MINPTLAIRLSILSGTTSMKVDDIDVSNRVAPKIRGCWILVFGQTLLTQTNVLILLKEYHHG